MQMQHLPHPQRESLPLPPPPQAGLRIALEKLAAARFVMLRERAREHDHIGECKVHPLGAGRRLNVRGIAGEEQPPILHRLDHEAAHRGDALLQHLAFGEHARAADARMQLAPDALVRPGLDLVVGCALQIEACEHRRAHGVERKAALVIGVDQLFVGWSRLRENADPSERIFAVIDREHARGDAGAADAVKAIAAAYEIALYLLVAAAITKADLRPRSGHVGEAHVVDLKQDLGALREPFRHQILDHLLLAVDGDALANQLAKIDVVQLATEAEMNAVVREAFALHALADAGVDQEIARPLLDQAGADAALDIITAAVLDDDRVDALAMEEMREHQARGPGTDYTDLCTHIALL